MFNAEKELQKWAPVLNAEGAPAIEDSYKKAVTAKLLENTEVALREEKLAGSFGQLDETTLSGAADKFDPVLISLVRRAMPNLIAYDVAGVQPMSGPTGLIFAMKAKKVNARDGSAGTLDTPDALPSGELLFNEADTDFSGAGAHSSTLLDSPITTGTGDSTAAFEIEDSFAEAGFTIQKQVVEAKTRALKAEYTMELAQDLKAVHGLDAESELANILSAEILAEINREVIRNIVVSGVRGAQAGTTPGTFNLKTDADGRWAMEKFQSLIFQIEQEANAISVATRRGKGNFVICSPNVASALASAGKMQFGGEGLSVDATGNTFAGTLSGGLKVYVDPYAVQDYATVGYKGANAYDAGVFYCPYVPLTMVRAVGENTFQPKIAFKTRYGLVQNPLIGNTPQDSSGYTAAAGSNTYFRTFKVDQINDFSS